MTQQSNPLLSHHRPCVIWFTGLSGAGKSTTAQALLERLKQERIPSYLLDGDELRQGLCQGLGFSIEDRQENIRRIGEAARLLVDAGLITLVAAIAPLQIMRDQVRARFGAGDYLEVFIDTPLSTCEARDPKGLYKKARQGELANFTGVGADYEVPQNPEIRLPAGQWTTEQCVTSLMEYLRDANIIHQP